MSNKVLRTINLYCFLLMFLAAIIVIALPTKTITTISEDSMLGSASILTTAAFRADVFTRYPNYLLGLGIIAGLTLIGAFLNTEIAAKILTKVKGDE